MVVYFLCLGFNQSHEFINFEPFHVVLVVTIDLFMGLLFGRDRAWAEEKKMFAYLSVANGSDEPPKFIELGYKGASDDTAPFALVGKGITFDRLVSSVLREKSFSKTKHFCATIINSTTFQINKYISFSGGISIKPSLNMDAMRADMGGAACVMASIYTAARLKLPINLKGILILSFLQRSVIHILIFLYRC